MFCALYKDLCVCGVTIKPAAFFTTLFFTTFQMDRQLARFSIDEFLQGCTKNLRKGVGDYNGTDEEKLLYAFDRAEALHARRDWSEVPYTIFIAGYRAFRLIEKDRGRSAALERHHLRGGFSQQYYNDIVCFVLGEAAQGHCDLNGDELALIFATREAACSLDVEASRRAHLPWYMFLSGYRVVWEMRSLSEERESLFFDELDD